MNDPAEHPKRSRRLLWAAVLLLVVTCGFGVWVWVMQPGRVRAELAKIRAAGEPVTAGELNALYQTPPAEQNATQLWLAAFAAIKPYHELAYRSLPIVGEGPEIPLPGVPWPEQQEVEKFLDQQAEALRLAHEAARRGGMARYPIDFAQGVNMLLPHVQDLRELARFLTLEAEVCAHRGDTQGAAEAIGAIFAAARSVEDEPVIISQLVRFAVDGIAVNEIERLLPAVELTDAQLEQLQSDLRRINYRTGTYRAMLGERVAGILAREDPATMGLSGVQRVGLWFFGSADEGFFLKMMGEMVAAARLPWPEAIRASEQTQDRVTAAKDPRYALTQLLVPAVSRVYISAARSTARVRAAAVAVAVELYRRGHGEMPETLERLVPEFLPEVPTDPFDGKRLRYVVREDDYLIYSVGADGQDDGGQEDRSSGEPDVVFRIRRRVE